MNAAVRPIVPAGHRSRHTRRLLLAGGLGIAALLAGLRRPGTIAAAPQWRYLIVDLGPGGEGGDWSTATAVNGAGQVAMTWATAIDPDRGVIDNIHPCLWEAGAVRDFSLLGLKEIRGLAEDGTALGTTGPQAVRVMPGADAAEPLPGFMGDAYATAIAPNGSIAGVIDGRPVILPRGEMLPQPLPLPDGFGYFAPAALNDAGLVAGVARVERTSDQGQRAAVVSLGGGATTLAPAPGGSSSAAAAINNSGHVAGGPAAAGMHGIPGEGRAFRHDLATGETLDLGTLPGYAKSFATAIDSRGRVAGIALDPESGNPFRSAWLWDEAAGLTDLNSLVPPGAGWLLSDVHAINDAGWIAGQGGFMGQRRGFLLVPVETI